MRNIQTQNLYQEIRSDFLRTLGDMRLEEGERISASDNRYSFGKEFFVLHIKSTNKDPDVQKMLISTVNEIFDPPNIR